MSQSLEQDIQNWILSKMNIIQFGNYLQAEQCTRGGFLPIFWDAPYSYINASIDIGEVVDWITDQICGSQQR